MSRETAAYNTPGGTGVSKSRDAAVEIITYSFRVMRGHGRLRGEILRRWICVLIYQRVNARISISLNNTRALGVFPFT